MDMVKMAAGWVLSRLQEPSTWVSLGLGSFVAENWIGEVAKVGVAVAVFLGFALKEKGILAK